jgi:hypothetical protein
VTRAYRSEYKMNKQIIKKIHTKEQQTDFNFWQSQSFQARIEALEQIRTEYNLWKYHAEQRFQRVCRVIKPE